MRTGVDNMENSIERAAELIYNAQKVVVFTGAGVSTESGIPDFRSPGGIWDKYEPVYYQDFIASEEARKKNWLRGRATYPVIRDARPNATHLALVDLEKMGKLDCIITQNIDRLHHKAGNSQDKIIELHGTNAFVVCLGCGRTYSRDAIQSLLEAKEEIDVPLCQECNGFLKEATVSFGQAMPEKEMAEAERRAQACDLMLSLGSSLVVYPAAYMPEHAKRAGAKLIIINMTPTPLDHMADIVFQGKTGEILAKIVQKVKSRSEI